MGTDPLFWALAVPAVLFAGIAKGGFGSGAAFVATPVLALAIGPGPALGLMLPLLMLIDLVTVRAFWGRWHRPSAVVLVLGAVPGVGLGALFYGLADPDLLRLLIGGLALGFVGFQIARRRGWLRPGAGRFRRDAGLLAGLTAGFTSTVSHAGGPPVAVFLLAQGMAKTPYQATTVLVFWVVNGLKLVPYAGMGLFTQQTLAAGVALAPVAVAGALLGVRAHALVSERLFLTLTHVALLGAGSKLIHDALV